MELNMGDFYYGGWAPYVPVAERRRKAERMVASLKKKGRVCDPVVIEGRAIARTFWGKNWCANLEAYSDYANRLPRGRTYARNGSVIDLQIDRGKISALVSGSSVYKVDIGVHPLDKDLWQAMLTECAGKVASLVELLQGRLSDAVMEVVTRQGKGLFPAPKQISFRCSCPDSATMCKHVAAVLYGIGARFDRQPELLFRLRHVDPQELIRQAGSLPMAEAPGEHRLLETTDLSGLFGIELDEAPSAAPAPAPAAGLKLPDAKRRATGTKAKDNVKSAPKTPRQSTAKKNAEKNAKTRPPRTKTVVASELIERGIPRHMVQSWLEAGVLLRTGQRGVYRTTKQTETRIEQYLSRRGKD
jgi:uncharacterized Zn finger protein